MADVVHPSTGVTVTSPGDLTPLELAIPEILNRLAAGELLKDILPAKDRPETMPSIGHFHAMVATDKPKGLADAYSRARESWAYSQAEEALTIADDRSGDTIIGKRKDGTEYEVANNEWIQRSRIRVDLRKWLIARFHRTQFGDKVEVQTTAATIPYPVVALPALDAPPERGDRPE